MVLVLDTQTIPAQERREALAELMRAAGIGAQITHHEADTSIRAEVRVWSLGGGVQIMHRSSSGIRLTQTRRAASTTQERISLSVISRGQWRFIQAGAQVGGTEGRSMVLTDHAAAYEYSRMDSGRTLAINLDRAALGLPVNVVQSAIGRLESSPLHGLVRQHIINLVHGLDEVEDGPAAITLGSATVELVRALICSAGRDEDSQRAALEDSLRSRVAFFVRRHIGDPGLSPTGIARAHNISVRQLYSVWAGSELSLAEWIMNERLELSRRELARPGSQAHTIAAIGRTCGFVDAAHFARRFRGAYGISPREWRQLKRRGAEYQPLAAQPAFTDLE